MTHTPSSLPIELITPSPHNPRKSFPEAALRELAESIRQVGVLQPILVRPTGADGRYELVAGERRWRAAQLAELDQLPVVVKELTDVQAAEVQVIENLQRADISPIEEAAGFRRLLDLGGYTADSLAEKLGKSRSHVFQRLRLLKMDPAITSAIDAATITPSVADLLATLPESIQSKALEEVVKAAPVAYAIAPDSGPDGESRPEPLSFRSVKKLLRQRFMRLADGAHFDCADETLNAPAGPCATCPHRAGTQPDAFPDLDIQTCLNPDCHEAKAREAFARKLDKIPEKQKKGYRVLTVQETLELFGIESITEFQDDDNPVWGSGMRQLGERPVYDFAELGETWQDVAENVAVDPVITLHPGNPTKFLRYVSEKECRKAAVKQGLITEKPSLREGSTRISEAERKAAQAKQELESAIDKATFQIAVPECHAAAIRWDKGEASFWAGFLNLLAEDGTVYDLAEWGEVLKQAGIAEDKLAKQNAEIVRALAVMWILGATSTRVTDEFGGSYRVPVYERVCAWLGVSWPAIRKQCQKVLQNAETAKEGTIETPSKKRTKRSKV